MLVPPSSQWDQPRCVGHREIFKCHRASTGSMMGVMAGMPRHTIGMPTTTRLLESTAANRTYSSHGAPLCYTGRNHPPAALWIKDSKTQLCWAELWCSSVTQFSNTLLVPFDRWMCNWHYPFTSVAPVTPIEVASTFNRYECRINEMYSNDS